VSTAAADPFDDFRRRRRKRLPRWVGPAALAAVVALAGLVFVLRGPTIGEQEGEHRIINVVLPPPPPPPPTPPKPTPEPIKPKIVEQPTPQPTPSPPQQTQQPTPQGDNALTAREGPAAGNFGLAVGNGEGTHIGGKPGGDPFGSYGAIVAAEIQRATERDQALLRQSSTLKIFVQVTPDGRISSVRSPGLDPKRDAALQRCLTGLQLSQRPPEGQSEVRVEINTRRGV
jgi:hypothetical protein